MTNTLLTLLGIVIGICGSLVATIYFNITRRFDQHEAMDDARFEKMEIRLTEMDKEGQQRHKENLAAFDRMSKAQLMMLMATISDNVDTRGKLVGMVQEMLQS